MTSQLFLFTLSAAMVGTILGNVIWFFINYYIKEWEDQRRVEAMMDSLQKTVDDEYKEKGYVEMKDPKLPVRKWD